MRAARGGSRSGVVAPCGLGDPGSACGACVQVGKQLAKSKHKQDCSLGELICAQVAEVRTEEAERAARVEAEALKELRREAQLQAGRDRSLRQRKPVRPAIKPDLAGVAPCVARMCSRGCTMRGARSQGPIHVPRCVASFLAHTSLEAPRWLDPHCAARVPRMAGNPLRVTWPREGNGGATGASLLAQHDHARAVP